jgi:excisionase family DNA binding protein
MMHSTIATRPEFRRKPAYGTGDVAALLGISPHVVADALDSGEIPGGYRHPGDGRHRRITDEALAEYLRSRPELADILARFQAATS